MPGFNWIKNMIGFKLNDDQLEDIPFPFFEMRVHISTKTLQTGAFLGMMVIAPVASFISGKYDRQSMVTRSLHYGAVGSAIGLGLGPLVAQAGFYYLDLDSIGAYDLCFRIRSNRNQVRVDQFSGVGALTGVAIYAKKKSDGNANRSCCESALVGMMGGMFTALFYNLVHNDRYS